LSAIVGSVACSPIGATVRKSIESSKSLESTLADPMMTAKLVKKKSSNSIANV